MFARMMAVCAVALFMAPAAFAENFEIQMLNRGEEGAMVFEPAFISASVGDTITFIATNRSHNVESIVGMLPEGVESFKSALNRDFVLTLDAEGLYGVKCRPHYSLGMIALIQVGPASNLEEAAAVRHPTRATQRFEPLFAMVQ